jgi:hypothetical protein
MWVKIGNYYFLIREVEIKKFNKSEEIDSLKWVTKKELLNLILKKKSTAGIISAVFYYLYKNQGLIN